MIYGKIDRYIMIAILVVVIIALVLIFMNRKENNEHHASQENLMLAMAEKLRVTNTDDLQKESKPDKKAISKQPEPTDEEDEQIVAIADKLCFQKPLTASEIEIQKRFPDLVKKEFEQSQKLSGIIIDKFMAGSKDFNELEQEYYQAFQQDIDNIINFKKYFNSIIQKIISGQTNWNDEELQFQQNYAKQIEVALSQVKKNSETNSSEMKGANPPISADERLQMILSFFEDSIPKTVTELATLYSKEAKVPFNKGNMSKVFGKLVDKGQLMCEKFKDGKVYHGPPIWFDGKKMKTEYKQKIKS